MRIAFTIAELARDRGWSSDAIWERIGLGALAFVVLRRGSVLVLAGDEDELPVAGEDGPATLRNAWRGRLWLTVAEVARALGVLPRMLSSMAKAGTFPAERYGAKGWWRIRRLDAIRWLLACRVPTRREIEAA